MTKPDVPKERLPVDVFALSAVRLIVSAGSFVGPFLAMMLTMKLGYNEAQAGVFMSAVSVVSAIGLVFGGKLGDSFGRPRVLRTLQALTALLLLTCAALGFSAATPFVIALAMGALSGSWPVMNALVADVTPPSRRKEAFSLMYWANNIGFSVGPLVAGFLFNQAPRLLFVGNAFALLVAAVVVSLWIKGLPYTGAHAESHVESETQPATSAASAQAKAPGKKALSTLTVLAANPILWMYALASVLTAFIYNQHTFALPVFLKDILGQDAGPKAYGMVMSANGLTVVAFTIPVMFLAKRMSNLSAIALSCAFYVFGFGSYWFARSLPLVLMSTVLWTVGEILGATSGNAFVAEHAPPAHRSRVNSAVSLAYIAGNAAAPLAAGPMARSYGSRSVWPLTSAMSALATVAFIGLRMFERGGKKAMVQDTAVQANKV